MSTKSPRRLRQDLEAARERIALFIAMLGEHEAERHLGLADECAKATTSLRRVLAENDVPQDYKVAVIGRFKAGKSSFVNELLGRRLAGEDTSPETAAITTFHAGDRVVARINLVDTATWDGLKVLHENDPTDPEAQRITNWFKFAARESRPGSAAQIETFDLNAIEHEHLRPGGHTLVIPLASASGAEAERKAENEFRRRIKQYTSSSKPYHCLVESIEIVTPSPLLGEGVVLVDTPGLDDTERFRVQLTERAVQEVDAVLFLTKSGAAYGQSEKDFLLSLLRKGTVKQLVFVVTQVDQTYEQHVRQARDQDEDPEPISARIAAERRRIRAEIEATLDELAGDGGGASTTKYREQLNAVEIAFTSAANHRDHVQKEPVKFPLRPDDPGGMREIKETLFRTLSTESRLAATKRAIQGGAASALQDLLSVLEKRRLVVACLKDREEAEQKLATFRREFEQSGERFDNVARQDSVILRTTLANRSESEALVAEVVALQADEVLGSYETDDAARHWRTRRGGNWGYMQELQTRVANRVFPKVAEQLSKQTSDFSDFVYKFRAHLRTLSDEAAVTVNRLEIGDELQLDIGASLEGFLEEALGALQELIEGEETRIVSLLEDFVDEEVGEKIADARERVSSVLGRGTTAGQTAEVHKFYREVRAILRAALQDHVKKRFEGFGKHLVAQAELLPEKTLSQVRAQIERASADIRAAAEAAIAGQKEAFERVAAGLAKEILEARTGISQLLSEEGEVTTPVAPPVAFLQSPSTTVSEPPVCAGSTAVGVVMTPKGAIENTVPASIQMLATRFIKRHILRNGEKGWPFTRILGRDYLNGMSEAWLIDPYLAQRHQRRNLKEFVMALTEMAKPKILHVITREITETSPDLDRAFYSELDREIFNRFGMKIQYSIDEDIHDRFLVLNNGLVFKLGRGIDLYKPVAGLAARDPGLRQTRACEIDVFGPDIDLEVARAP